MYLGSFDSKHENRLFYIISSEKNRYGFSKNIQIINQTNSNRYCLFME